MVRSRVSVVNSSYVLGGCYCSECFSVVRYLTSVVRSRILHISKEIELLIWRRRSEKILWIYCSFLFFLNGTTSLYKMFKSVCHHTLLSCFFFVPHLCWKNFSKKSANFQANDLIFFLRFSHSSQENSKVWTLFWCLTKKSFECLNFERSPSIETLVLLNYLWRLQ